VLQEKELVERSREGDRAALDRLLYESYPIVFGYLLKMGRDEELARDITQEVMVKAILNITKFRGESKFSSWLLSMAVNLFRDGVRKKKPVSLEEVPESGRGQESAEDVALKEESKKSLIQKIDRLPPEQKQVFLLKYFYDMTYEEIARSVSCPVGTVRSRLHNGMRKLREEMGKEEDHGL